MERKAIEIHFSRGKKWDREIKAPVGRLHTRSKNESKGATAEKDTKESATADARCLHPKISCPASKAHKIMKW